MVLIPSQFRRCFLRTAWKSSIHIKLIKAAVLGLLCFILVKFCMKIPQKSETTTIRPVWATTILPLGTIATPPVWASCSQYKDTGYFSERTVPHFECEISKNDPKPGILNILQYLKPHWDIDKVIHSYYYSAHQK